MIGPLMVCAWACCGSAARADSPWLYGLHFWGFPAGQPVDPVPAALLDCPQYGGWNLEVILTHGEVFQKAAYFAPFYADLYTNKNVSLITRVDYNWGETVASPTNPDSAAWPNAVADAVSQLAASAHIWAVGNEPNILGEGSTWPDSKVTPAGYAAIYRNVRNAIRTRSASSPAGPHQVLIAPVSPGPVYAGVRWMSGNDWLGQVIDNIPSSEIDGFAVHSYGGSLQDFHNGYVEQLNLIDAKGLANRPVYMTEWNRYAGVGNATQEAEAAQFCRDAFADVHAWNQAPGHHNIIAMCWFVYDGGDGTGGWDGFSLEYWRTHGNPAGSSGDLFTAFEQAVDQRYPAGLVGTRPFVPPVAAFAAGPIGGAAPLSVQFTDQSTSAAAWAWDFGDGRTASDRSPLHVYSQPGAYSVRLTVTNAVGSHELTKAKLIGIAPPEKCSAQRLASFEPQAVGSQVMFRSPRTSGTTVGHLAASPNLSAVSDEGTAFDGARACKLQWAWLDAGPSRWLRLTTNNTAVQPNPTIDLNRAVRLRLRLDSGSLRVCIGLRETGVNVPVGSDGGVTGPIEWVGAESVVNGVPQGRLITAQPGVWQRLTFVPRVENVRAFTGDGVLSAANHRGVLEHIAFTPVGSAGPITAYLDGIEQPCPVGADIDGDRDVDQGDFGLLQRCFSGPYIPQLDPACTAARLDGDADVDDQDFAVFSGCFDGPSVMADPDCVD